MRPKHSLNRNITSVPLMLTGDTPRGTGRPGSRDAGNGHLEYCTVAFAFAYVAKSYDH